METPSIAREYWWRGIHGAIPAGGGAATGVGGGIGIATGAGSGIGAETGAGGAGRWTASLLVSSVRAMEQTCRSHK